MHSEPFVVAVAQATPVYIDRAATVAKACGILREAAAHNARLVVFPEAFVPCYPFWIWHIAAGETRALRELYVELLDNAVRVPGPETEQLCLAARESGVAVAIGINEINVEGSGTTLYNSLLYIDGEGRIAGCHRKLIPTGGERLVHGQGDGSTLDAVDLPFAKVGGLICWENYMPLARFAMYAAGVEVYLAPTWDRGEPWVSTLRHIAKEGRCYVIGCCSAVRRADIDDRYAFKRLLPESEWINPGGSAVVDPDGKFVIEPVREREEVLYAELSPALIRGPRWQLDVAGHYARPDVFELTVNREGRPLVRDRRT
jgi:nitrilase